MTQERIFGVLAVAVVALAAGCNGGTQVVDASMGAPRQADPVSDLVAQSRPPIPDLPVPIGFYMDESKSRNYAFAGGRLVDHVYSGRGDKLAIKRFYERQMPISRWALVTAMFVQGDIMMDFERDNERCRVSLNDAGWFSRVHIKIYLTTSGKLENPAGPTRR